MKRLSPTARSVLAEYRGEHDLEPAERQRMLRALEQRLASGPPALEIDAEPPRLPLDSIAPRALSRPTKLAGVVLGMGLALLTARRFARVQDERLPRVASGGRAPYQYNWDSPDFSGPGPHRVCPTTTTSYAVLAMDADFESNHLEVSGTTRVVVDADCMR